MSLRLRQRGQADEELLCDRPAVFGNRDCAPATGPFQGSRRLASRAACDWILLDVGGGKPRLDQEGRPSSRKKNRAPVKSSARKVAIQCRSHLKTFSSDRKG